MRKLLCAGVAFYAAIMAQPAYAGFWVNPIMSASGAADIDDSHGNDVKTTTYGIMGGNEFFTLGYKNTHYSFSGWEPIDKLQMLFADIHYASNFNEHLGYFVGLELASGWEEDFSLSDNYSIRPRVGISYAIDRNFSLLLGVKANFNEADNRFIPIVGLKYRDPSEIGFSTLLGYPETTLQYRFNNYLALMGRFYAVNQDVYQLRSDSPMAPDGYLVEESMNGRLGLVFTPMQTFSISAGLDASFNREYKVYNEYGDELKSWETDTAWGGYVNFDVNF